MGDERNGWCRGAVVVGDILDITDNVTAGEDNVFDYDILLQNGVFTTIFHLLICCRIR